MALFELENKHGFRAKISSLGGILMELHVPDRDGKLADVVLGFDEIEQYDEKSPYFGALIGRFGNRIARGRYFIDGAEYAAVINNAPNSLHGGAVGFDKVEWSAERFEGDGFQGLKLGYVSPDGEEGYPGTLTVGIVYKITDENEWIIEYEAKTDKPTILNLTQHAYFNLAGHDSGDHLNHEVKIEADFFTPINEALIPTGEVRPVEGTVFDFREAKPIGRDVDADDVQVDRAGGFDHNFVLRKCPDEFALAATVKEPKSGRIMEVYTTEPGAQFYTGNFLDGSNVGKGGAAYHKRSGLCVETQHFPDSPNHAHFPSTRLDPGQIFRSKTAYLFSAD